MTKHSVEIIVGPEIKALRKQLKYTQAQFASLLRVHPITVCHWERGESVPHAKHRKNLGSLKKYLHDIKRAQT